MAALVPANFEIDGKEPKRLMWQDLLLISCSVMSDSCDPMNCSPPGSSVHGISQERILEWVVIFYSRGSSQPRDLKCFLLGRRIPTTTM